MPGRPGPGSGGPAAGTIVWLDDALADVEDIHRHIAADDPVAAARIVQRIQDATDRLALVPHLGRPGRWPGTRELVLSPTPYLVPYRVRAGVVQILRVLHGARRWPERP
jgi:toxin ParE1/3/4